jgi:SAM-dependent methyltransferase
MRMTYITFGGELVKTRIFAGNPAGAKAAVVVAFWGERFLLVDTGRGWEFPGGSVERWESPEEAAVREMGEETGCETDRLRYVCRGGKGGECAIFTCELRSLPPSGELHARRPKNLRFPAAEFDEFLGAAWRARTDYDEVSKYFDSVRPSDPSATDYWLDRVIRSLGLDGGATVADIGCGSGRYSYGLARRGLRVVGVDFSGGMLAKALSKGGESRLDFTMGDAQRLPLRGGFADGALIFLALHHMPVWRLAIAEAARVLKPGGSLLVVTTSKERIKAHQMRFFPGAVELDLGRFQGVGELKSEMARAGFTGVKSKRELVRRGFARTDDIMERYRRKHLSTLALVPDAEFEGRLVEFERRLRKRYGGRAPDDTELTFVTGFISKKQKTI